MLLRYFHRRAEPAHLTVLRNVPLFSGLNTHDLGALDDLLHQRSYVQDEIIFDQGEEGQAIYFVLSGKVLISRQGYKKAIAELEAGQFFGERAFLEDAPRVAQARTTEDCVLAVLFHEDFLVLLQTHPEIAEKIAEHCSLRNANQPIEIDNDSSTGFSNHHNVPGPVTWVGIIAVTCLLLLIFKTILWLVVPFLLALILYYLLAPLAKRMVLAGFSSHMAAITLSGVFLLGTGLLVLLFYPWAIANATHWQSAFTGYLSGGAALIESILHGLQQRFTFLHDAQFGEDIYQQFRDFTEHFSDKHLSNLVYGLAAWLPSLLLTPVIAFFLLQDGAYLRKMVGGAVPNAFFEKTLYLIHAMDRTARLYFVGLMKITVLDTVLMALGLSLLGISSPVLLGLIAAVLSWIPYLGPLLGCGVVLMVAATDSPGDLSLIYSVIGLFITIRMLDDFVFLPMIVGKSLRIHPLLTVMMFLVGEAIAGIAGLMLAIPILGIVMVLGETLEIILTDTRLQARHRHSQKLRWRAANHDLSN